MEAADVGPALQERLGPEATAALVDLFDVARREWTADVTTAAVERFERRLSDEVGGLRAEIRSLDTNLRLEIAGVRQELKSDIAGLREEMREGDANLRLEIAGLRQELKSDIAGLREEMGEGDASLRLAVRDADASLRLAVRDTDASLRQAIRECDANLREAVREGDASFRLEISGLRTELLKWSFAFSFGQIIAVATIVGVMLRMMQS
jgi:hypothetical protein